MYVVEDILHDDAPQDSTINIQQIFIASSTVIDYCQLKWLTVFWVHSETQRWLLVTPMKKLWKKWYECLFEMLCFKWKYGIDHRWSIKSCVPVWYKKFDG